MKSLLDVLGYAIDGPGHVSPNNTRAVGNEEEGLLATNVELLDCPCVSVLIVFRKCTRSYPLLRDL